MAVWSKPYQAAYDAVESRFDVPNQGPFLIGLGMIAPTILAHGTATAKDRYLRALWRGDIIACQLFSEPGVGSDLASLQTRAERDGDEWVLTGQKVWTSGAQYSDIGEILARTDPDLPKHKGLTGFIVDMRAPGVEIRPLRQMTGGASFNEVFFNEVRVPDDHRLGDVNGGWSVALTTLMNERAAIGAGGMAGGGAGTMTRLIEMVRYFGLSQDAARPPAPRRRDHQGPGCRLHQPASPRQDQRWPAARPRIEHRQARRDAIAATRRRLRRPRPGTQAGRRQR